MYLPSSAVTKPSSFSCPGSCCGIASWASGWVDGRFVGWMEEILDIDLTCTFYNAWSQVLLKELVDWLLGCCCLIQSQCHHSTILCFHNHLFLSSSFVLLSSVSLFCFFFTRSKKPKCCVTFALSLCVPVLLSLSHSHTRTHAHTSTAVLGRFWWVRVFGRPWRSTS